jgi:hypothetical protein
MKKDLLTVKELAAELRMSPKSIQRAYRKEEIPVEWLGRMTRFNLAHVRRAMARNGRSRMRRLNGRSNQRQMARRAGLARGARRGGWSIWSVSFVLLVGSENRSEESERPDRSANQTDEPVSRRAASLPKPPGEFSAPAPR